jgi:hypothetical protein
VIAGNAVVRCDRRRSDRGEQLDVPCFGELEQSAIERDEASAASAGRPFGTGERFVAEAIARVRRVRT